MRSGSVSGSGSGSVNVASLSAPRSGTKPVQAQRCAESDWKSRITTAQPAGPPGTKTWWWSLREWPHASQRGESLQDWQTSSGRRARCSTEPQ